MAESARVAMVAALEREVRPLVKHWTRVDREYEGRRFKFFEAGDTVILCGGIGAEAARRATEAVAALYQPELICSVGFAGALDPGLKVGEIFLPARVIDARDGSMVETGSGSGILISAGAVAGVEQKAQLAKAYGAQAVDMEAAAVARGAQARGMRFMAVKAISDESDFFMPAMDRFVASDGHFREMAFIASALVRPWLWPRFFRLARSAAKASKVLCVELEGMARSAKGKSTGPELHSVSKAVN